MCLWKMNALAQAVFWKLWPWWLNLTMTDYFDLGIKERSYPKIYTCEIFKLLSLSPSTLTDDLDLGTKEKVLRQRIHTWNMKAVSLSI